MSKCGQNDTFRGQIADTRRTKKVRLYAAYGHFGHFFKVRKKMEMNPTLIYLL